MAAGGIAACVVTSAEVLAFINPVAANAATENDNNASQLNLVIPTKDRPQIQLPTSAAKNEPLVQGTWRLDVPLSSVKDVPASILKNHTDHHDWYWITHKIYVYKHTLSSVTGLIYFKNPRIERPPPDSVMLVTVRRQSNPEQVLQAARIPLATQRLPLQFQFPRRDNPIMEEQEDLIVEAVVCDPLKVDLATKTCAKPFMTGSGVAKALSFPSPDDPSQVVRLRAGVSVALE